jgi:hypothetical protein
MRVISNSHLAPTHYLPIRRVRADRFFICGMQRQQQARQCERRSSGLITADDAFGLGVCHGAPSLQPTIVKNDSQKED